MSQFRRKSGKFTKKSHFERNLKVVNSIKSRKGATEKTFDDNSIISDVINEQECNESTNAANDGTPHDQTPPTNGKQTNKQMNNDKNKSKQNIGDNNNDMCDVEITNVGQQSDLQPVCGDDHNYSVTETRNENGTSTQIDLSAVHREEVCVADDEDLEIDYGIANNTSKNMDLNWKEGRVVVDLDTFFRSLICKNCSLPLDASKTIGIQREGVCGYLSILCSNPACEEVSRVPMGKTHRRSTRGPPVFDVNTKISIGKCDVHVYNLL